ncbi:MAG: hypothetical protein FWC10_01205 [Lentimicrobiaceae bacterium]|nr:hypothetical protein [Lentimicrobiaceae bacterium]
MITKMSKLLSRDFMQLTIKKKVAIENQKKMKLFLKILLFSFSLFFTVGEANSSTMVTISQAATASSLFQETQFTHCKNEFGLLDRQLSSSQVAHLKSLHSDKTMPILPFKRLE